MRANELMINDLIYDTINRRYGKVFTISLAEPLPIGYYFGVNSECYILERIAEPIPITPEILEANGFYMVKGDESENIAKPDVWVYEKEDKVIVIGLKEGDFASFEIYNNRRSTSFTDSVCVSELQHAMRTMGMHELADNFIIEKGGAQ